ncbi:succinate dehydrogenase cytochrome B subunit, b558 family [Bacteriovorax sp. BSW11_IV]|uniref:succinate dehydrogenase cytochrome b subunit n=1 Tax=Bacteriovorax sp. BSW11_IV TaxID=1353529 RepID=UPI00038A1FA5|nr:succinate dehydrogenase cytochrome b subunit [Bacteriovorax sp. BSW11_IV]EQC49386.1 succinate dehydrogenase cytochrome B subunit, b558 family [Bacteriovorax sp. BSW11_IV]
MLINRKYIMAITGLFLCIFLIVHLSANFLLLLPNNLAKEAYNTYSHLLRNNPLISAVSILLYLAIIFHSVMALIITLDNKKAKPQKYFMNYAQQNSSWNSRNMGLLGLMILIFIIVHMANFWAKVKLGYGPELPIDSKGQIDIYSVVVTTLKNPFITLFYTILSIPLAMHLHHGVQSAAKTLGLYHKRYLKYVALIATFYSCVMGLGFGLIPLYIYFFSQG